jgi:glycine hydroxymethyltransferase
MILAKARYAESIHAAVEAILGSPHIHTVAANAVALHQAAQPEFTARQKQVIANARTLGNALSERGFAIVTGGTDTHMVLFDAGAPASDAAQSLASAGIITNDIDLLGFTNGVIRIGTSELTARGMVESDMTHVARLITEILNGDAADDAVSALAKQFPID